MEAVVGVVFVALIAAAMVVLVHTIIVSALRRRYLHRERMVALEKGLPLPDDVLSDVAAARRPGNHNAALNGIIWTGIGAGLFLSSRFVMAPEFGSDFRQFLLFLRIWSIPAFLVGAGLLVYAYLIRDRGK
jgi:hypothetical protein